MVGPAWVLVGVRLVVFEYLKTPSLAAAVCQCLTAIVHQAFGTAQSHGWYIQLLGKLHGFYFISSCFYHV